MAIYSAPSVRYATGRSIRLAVVLFFMLLLGTISAGLYGYQTCSLALQCRWQTVLIAASWLFAAACMVQFWTQLKHGCLDWDGLFWHWTTGVRDVTQDKPSPQAGRVSVRFDGQRCLLLKFEPSEPSLETGRTQWLWLEQAFAPEHWHDVRRAVYSRANEPVFNAQQ